MFFGKELICWNEHFLFALALNVSGGDVLLCSEGTDEAERTGFLTF